MIRIGRLVRIVLGANAVERTIERVLSEVQARAERGLPEVTVSVSQTEIGSYRRLSKVTPIVVERLQQAGHAVLGTTAPNGDWASLVSLRVRPSTVPASDE